MGLVTFLSEVYGGRLSDVHISYGIHWTGDQILVDHGFALTEEFAVA